MYIRNFLCLEMYLKKLLFFLIQASFLIGTGQSAELSPSSTISVITCGPGEELYASFGHSAFRVLDPVRGTDLAYNYGTFDFRAANFYVNFARGKLLYYLSGSTFPDFLATYRYEGRWVREQVLNLGLADRKLLFAFLENNRQPENRDYKYDFLFDNCSTKIPEVLKEVLGQKLIFEPDHLKSQKTFRQLIRQNLQVNSWSSFGIDLALGSMIDRLATPEEHMFLPYYVMLQLQNSKINNAPLVATEQSLLPADNNSTDGNIIKTPGFWLGLLLLVTLMITYFDFRHHARNRWLDFSLFMISGLAGLLIIFLWFLTEHSTTANNMNILWAIPFNALTAYYCLSKKGLPHWFTTYCAIALGFLLLIPVIWLSGIQQFSPLILIFMGTLAVRYGFLWHHTARKKIIA